MRDVRFHSQCLGSRCLDDGELTNQRPVLWPYDPSEATGRIDQTSLAFQGFRIVNFYKHKHASCAAYLPSHVTTPKYSLLKLRKTHVYLSSDRQVDENETLKLEAR